MFELELKGSLINLTAPHQFDCFGVQRIYCHLSCVFLHLQKKQQCSIAFWKSVSCLVGAHGSCTNAALKSKATASESVKNCSHEVEIGQDAEKFGHAQHWRCKCNVQLQCGQSCEHLLVTYWLKWPKTPEPRLKVNVFQPWLPLKSLHRLDSQIWLRRWTRHHQKRHNDGRINGLPLDILSPDFPVFF